MALESVSRITDLVTTNPTTSDPRSEGDDHLRNIKTAVKTLLGFPRVHVHRTTTQSIPNNTSTEIAFDAETYDPQGMHSTVSATERLVVPTSEGGYYLVVGQAHFVLGSGAGVRSLVLRKNGVAVEAQVNRVPNASYGTVLRVVSFVLLVPTDYLTLAVLQDSGGSIDLGPASSPYLNYFQAVKLYD